MFSRMNHVLGHKENLNKYRKIEIMSLILLDHSQIKLDISIIRNYKKYMRSWQLRNTHIHNWVKGKIKKGKEKLNELSKNENTKYQNL